jgi:predicted nucleic acid-binding protein
MICLDTNYLIRMLIPDTVESKRVKKWLKQGETLSTSSIAWYEFLCGPVGEAEIQTVRVCLQGGIVPFEEAQITEAARLYNATGRSRRLRVDAMIAACAVTANIPLATDNRDDFCAFVKYGLILMPE